MLGRVDDGAAGQSRGSCASGGGQHGEPGRGTDVSLALSTIAANPLMDAALHMTPFIQSGVVIAPAEHAAPARVADAAEACDYCGSARLEWRKCKLICADCRQINKSCADL